MVIAY